MGNAIQASHRHQQSTDAASSSSNEEQIQEQQQQGDVWYGTFEGDDLIVVTDNSGGDIDGDEDEDYIAINDHLMKHSDSYHALIDLPPATTNDDDDNHEATTNRKVFWKYITHVIYLSEFAIIGSILRVYLGKFFGSNCETIQQQQQHSKQQQSMFPLSLCWTHSGKYDTNNSYLFIDLPANLIGSFIMGILNPLVNQNERRSHAALPWFHRRHILQTHDAFITGLRTGICGSLTTFSSWNTQMIVMAYNGQIVQAILGYLLGLVGPACAYIVGSFVHYQWNHAVHNSVDGRRQSYLFQNLPSIYQHQRFSRLSFQTQLSISGWMINYLPLILCVFLFLWFGIIGDAILHDLSYRTMWFICLVSPLGAILRWRLGQLNESSWVKCPCGLDFIPWGTFLANMLAVCLSVTTEATNTYLKSIKTNDDTTRTSSSSTIVWLIPILSALQTGFGGSLSTVSTWLKEVFAMSTFLQGTIYAIGTICCAATIGFVIYYEIISHSTSSQ